MESAHHNSGLNFFNRIYNWLQRYKIILFTLYFFITLAMVYTSFVLMRDEWLINHHFLETSCTILYKHSSKDVTLNNGSKQHSKAPSFYVRYKAGNHSITEWTGLSPLSSNKPHYTWNNWTDIYEVDQTYPCWYNPDEPMVVALERGYSTNAILFSLISAYLLGSLIYLTIKAIKVRS